MKKSFMFVTTMAAAVFSSMPAYADEAQATSQAQATTELQQGDAIDAAAQALANAAAVPQEEAQAFKAQLRRARWSAADVDDAARTMSRMRDQKRWHRQAREMLRECVNDSACTPTRARVTLDVMRQASRRADLDPRVCVREIRLAMREEAAQGGKGAALQGSGDELRSRLQKRLRLHAQDEDGVAGNGSGEQKRHRYRRGMDGESRQGGGYGGGQSGGVGAGWGGGSGNGGGKQGQGGN